MSNTVGVKDPLHGRVSSSFSQRAPGFLISEGTGYITRIQSATMISIQERCSWMISVLRLSIGVLLQLYPSLRKSVLMESHFELWIGSICFVGWFVLSRCLITVYQTLLIGLRLEMKLRGQRCITQLCRSTINSNGRAAGVCPCVWWHLGDDV